MPESYENISVHVLYRRDAGGKWQWLLMDVFDYLITSGKGHTTKGDARAAAREAKAEYRKSLEIIKIGIRLK